MTKYWKILIFILWCTSCHPHNKREKIELSSYELHFTQEGGEQAVQVNARRDWRDEKHASWLLTGTTPDDHYIVNALPNDSSAREETILFICGKDTARLHIAQSGNETFTVSCSDTLFTYEGGSAQISIVCYDNWSITEISEWITAGITEGNSPKSIPITVKSSDSREDTTGKIIFSSKGRDITLYIKRLAKPFVDLEKGQYEIDGDGGNITILYLSNSRVSIDTLPKWSRLVHHDTISRKIIFEIYRNPEYTPREGSVTLFCTDYPSVKNTFSILQGEKIEHPSISFEEGYKLDIHDRGEISLHPVFTDMKDTALTWLSSDTEIATVDQNGTVTILNSGECRIRATNSYHNISAEISLDIRLSASKMTVMLGNQDTNTNTTAVRFVGEKMAIRVILEPENSYMGDIICYSSDPQIVKTEGFNVECISEGTATITVESLYHKLSHTFKMIIITL